MSPRLMAARKSSERGKRGLEVEDVSARASKKMCLDDLSNPPTRAELDAYESVPAEALPSTYKRESSKRVFPVRNLNLKKIKFVGFDMDYTLACYKAPTYEAMLYGLVVARLLDMGYPDSIATLAYDPDFPIRGLCIDTKLGNLVKLDEYGALLAVTHGRRKLRTGERYPSKYINMSKLGRGKRFYVCDTLFSLPEACLYADLISHFESSMTSSEHGIEDAALSISYEALFTDLRAAVDHVHLSGVLKQTTTAALDTYVEPQPSLGPMLRSLRARGIVVFLLTNSGYAYTDKIMTYLLDADWRSYFDIAIVAARKPLFFGQGTALREVEIPTGNLKLHRIDSFKPGAIYQGGSLRQFSALTGARGSDVLYVGDHIFGDVIKSKTVGWRTLLVVRELAAELAAFTAARDVYTRLANLEWMLNESYRGLDAAAAHPPDVDDLHNEIRATVKRLAVSTFGSAFRTGSRKSLFASQIERFADLYAVSFANLANYPLVYSFRVQASLMPHELVGARGGPGGGDDSDSDSDDDDVPRAPSTMPGSVAASASDDESDEMNTSVDVRHGAIA